MPDLRILPFVIALAGASLIWRDVSRAFGSSDRSPAEQEIRRHLRRKLRGFAGGIVFGGAFLFGTTLRWPVILVWCFALAGIASMILWVREVFQVHALKAGNDRDPER